MITAQFAKSEKFRYLNLHSVGDTPAEAWELAHLLKELPQNCRVMTPSTIIRSMIVALRPFSPRSPTSWGLEMSVTVNTIREKMNE